MLNRVIVVFVLTLGLSTLAFAQEKSFLLSNSVEVLIQKMRPHSEMKFGHWRINPADTLFTLNGFIYSSETLEPYGYKVIYRKTVGEFPDSSITFIEKTLNDFDAGSGARWKVAKLDECVVELELPIKYEISGKINDFVVRVLQRAMKDISDRKDR